jgi:hypothetical protein
MSKEMKSIIITAAVASFMLGSCSKRFLNRNPVTQVGAENYYKTASDILNAVNGAYGSMQTGGQYSESYYFLADYPADNVENQIIAAQYDFDQFDRFYVNSANTYINPFWTDNYKGIIRCNNIIDKAPGVTMVDSLRSRYVGEAKYLRALMYFNLVRVFGDVPLVTRPVNTVEDSYQYGRTAVADVYTQIIADLTDAAAGLPATYPNSDLGRATSGSARTLLAEVDLTLKKYSDAAALLKTVIDSKVYKLLPVYTDVFNPANGNNAEIVFAVNYKKGGIGEGSPFVNVFCPTGGVGVGALVITGTSGNRMAGTQDLFNAFEPNDLRRFISVDTAFTDATGHRVQAIFTRKYLDVPFADKDGDNDWFVHRYSDVLLMYAEALNETGQTADAHEFLNDVRERAGLADKTGLNHDDLAAAIAQERRVELCFEGHRWWDLKRTEQAVPVMNAYFTKYNVSNGGVVIQIGADQLVQPIPLTQIQINSALKQNHGYTQ